MKKPFCLYLNNQLRVDQDHLKPCCWITKKFNFINGTKKQLTEYQNWLGQIDEWIPECNFCQEKELRDVLSPRQKAENNPLSVGISDTTDINKLTALEFQIDSNCNAACLMCGPHNSTTWQKYNIVSITNKSKINKHLDLVSAQLTESRYNKLYEYVKLDDVNLVKFLGGEPLDSDFHKKVLLDIQKVKPLNQVSARYITNGSKRPDDTTVELWRQLRSLQIVFSIDGIGDHFNYLRWPLQWNQVESNIKYFIDLKIPTVHFGISSAVSPLNIFYYDRYIAWERTFFKNSESMNDRFSQAFDAVDIINTSSIPPALQDAVKEKYLKMPWLVNTMRPFDQVKYDQFIKYIEFHDSKRNLKWKEVFSEIVEYFKQ